MAVSRIINAKFVVDHKELTDGIVLTKKELREASKVVQEFRSPLKSYAEEVARIDRFHRAGILSLSEFDAANEKSLRTLKDATGETDKERAAIEARTKAIQDAEREQKAYDSYMSSRAAAVSDSVRSDYEKEQQQLRELNTLRREGRITQATFDRARSRIAERRAERDIVKAEISPLQRDADRVIESVITPLQRYKSEVATLEVLHRRGLITNAQYGAALTNARQSFIDATPPLSRFVSMLDPITLSAAAVTAGLAAIAGGVYALSSATLTGIERLDSMADSAAALGMESRQFQRLRAAATLADAPVDKLDSMVRKVVVSVAEATDESSSLGKQFRELGLDANALVAASPEEMLSAIGSAIGKLPTSAEQLKAINDIAGRGNYQFRQLLLNFTDFANKADRFTLRDDAFGNIDDADVAMKELGLQFEHITDIIAVSFAPVVTEISEQLSAMATDGRLDQMASGMETVAGWAVKIASGLANAVQHLENLHHLLSLGGMAQDVNEMILGPEGTTRREAEAERERAKRDIAEAIERRRQQAAKNQLLIEEEGAAATKADEKRLKEAERTFREFEAMFGRGTADDARLLGEEVKRLPTEFEKASQARREFMSGLEADAMAAGKNERQLVEFKARQLGLSDAEVNRALKLFDRAQAGRRSLEETPSGVSPAVKGSQEAAAAIARWRTNQDKQLDALEQIEHNTRQQAAIIIEPVEIR